MRRLIEWLFPTQHDPALTADVERANSALEHSKREAAVAKDEHDRATERLARAMTESVEIAQDALRRQDD